ncbi:Hsp70 family protein [Desulfopila sp. IMCC35006]|uniref:Hsp70 family protein n=1 Tax=Desulfopila sp. IMCC35006 TaxID=2569542 RepID=UPI0010AD4C2E|nr:Hsp70 family protein [Desulfopila sp. IMCC35006]TKB26488.1 Hsp70 family protein [Desulfopila sp. IMCC35006]
MKNFVGIDLGTTNSAICSYDGSETRIWKSPEQNDVTPSAIYIDRRGNKYVGKRAYDSAPHSPDNSALLFKRLMGTSTPVQLSAVDMTKSPEECSAEVLKVLFGYLPEEIRNNPDTGTVITVPAAFNQMQKDATMQAATMAGLGKVAIMQEPVAAVMSVMRARNADGMFLIYDLGGGTLDIAIAESLGGRVNLLAHGGIAMCGGRDFDRVLVDNVVRPWLLDNFALPEDFSVNPTFKSLIRLAIWATERAKIELSAREEAVISLSETEARVRDLDGNEIYLDIPLLRDTYDKLIADRVGESIASARDTLSKAGLTPHDLERIVFVGGPTNYKPLRDKVAFELGIPGSTDVNPMTAVAEGASLFAESIDWSSQNRSRKNTRGQISSGGGLALSFNYIARTPDVKAKIAVQLAGKVSTGSEFQVDSADTGWTSGRLPLKHGTTIDVTLTKTGDNTFKVFVFDSVGGPIALDQDKIVITRTAATVDAIPASHSVGIEVLEKLGGRSVLDYLVRSGDSLPKKGKKVFKAAESLKSGASGSLNLKLWEGEIEDPITDNRPIGVLKISGSDFDDGVIPAGADLECDFEILDSGNIIIEVSVPCIGGTFHSGKNFYSRQEGQLDYTSASVLVAEEGERTLNRIDEINEVVDNPKLEQARKKLESAISLDPEEAETEKAQEAMENIFEARRLLAQVRKEHLKEIRKIDLDGVVSFFDEHIRQHARPSEATAFDNLARTAQRSIDRNDKDFEHHLDELKGKNFEILWRQDWFVVERFKSMVNSPHLFADKHRFEELANIGAQVMRSDDIEKLRAVVAQLSMIQIGGGSDNEMFDVANIIRG